MKFGWRGAFGVVISVAFLYFAFRNIEWARAVETARHTNYVLLVCSAAAATGMFPLRARRWRTILDPIAPSLPFGPLWRATAIGAMVTNVVPLRAGELARAYVLAREVKSVAFSTSLASIAVDRVFDAIVTLLLLAIGLLIAGSRGNVIIHGYSIGHLAMLFAVAPFALLVILYVLVFFPHTLIRLFELTARRVSPVIEQRGSDMLRRFADGLSVLRSPGHFIAVFGWTLAHWLLQPFAFWLAFRAVGIDPPIAATLIVQGIIVILVALPSLPGFFGTFEYGATLALGLYSISNSDAATWALIFHVASFIPITVIGAYYSAKLGLSMSDVGGAANLRTAERDVVV